MQRQTNIFPNTLHYFIAQTCSNGTVAQTTVPFKTFKSAFTQVDNQPIGYMVVSNYNSAHLVLKTNVLLSFLKSQRKQCLVICRFCEFSGITQCREIEALCTQQMGNQILMHSGITSHCLPLKSCCQGCNGDGHFIDA